MSLREATRTLIQIVALQALQVFLTGYVSAARICPPNPLLWLLGLITRSRAIGATPPLQEYGLSMYFCLS